MTRRAKPGARTVGAGLDGLEAWFVTGSQDLYGEAVLARVDENARHIARCLDEAAAVPGPDRGQAGRHDARGDRRGPARGGRRRRRASASSPGCTPSRPAKMWIGGLTDLRKPLVHLHTQYNRDLPWADIDMDFMNLNQAAHGDREFAFIQTRLRRGRKTVVGHWEDPAVLARLGAWSRAAAGWHEAHRLRVARFGDNMRHVAVTEGDKVEAQARLGFSVNGYGVSDLAERVGRDRRRRRSTTWSTAYEDEYDVALALRRGGERHAELRTAARIEAGLRSFLGGRRLRRLHRHVRGPRRARAAAGHRRPAADGRRLRLRRRGRLEGRRARPDPEGHGRRAARRDLVHGGLHLPPRRPGARGPRRPHARGLPVAHRRPALVRDPPALDRRPLGPGPARLRRGARARRSSSAWPTSATASG